MAPELIGDGAPSRASDIYAAGIMLYELLSGVTPFRAQHALALMNKHVHQAPGRSAGIPDPLWSLISALLAKQPEQRPQDAGQVAGWLEQLLPHLTGLPALPALADPPRPPGGEVPAGATTGASTIITPLPPAAAAGPDRRRSRRIWWIAGSLAVLLAALAVGAYLLLRPEPDLQPTPAPATSTPLPTSATATPAPSPSATGTPASSVPESASPGPNPQLGYVLPDYTGKPLSDVVPTWPRMAWATPRD